MSAIPHPRAVELVARAKLRRKVERTIDRLVAILNDLDGDPDLEPDVDSDQSDDEPTLGALDVVNQRHGWRVPAYHGEAEPSLGAPERAPDCRAWSRMVDRSFSQTAWAAGGDTGEREQVNEGAATSSTSRTTPTPTSRPWDGRSTSTRSGRRA